MASSSSTLASLATNLGPLPSQKLRRDNMLFRKALVFPRLRCALAFGLLDGTDAAPQKMLEATDDAGKKLSVPNPEYATWVARDQFVQGWLNDSLSPDILAHVLDKTSTTETWATISASHVRQRLQGEDVSSANCAQHHQEEGDLNLLLQGRSLMMKR
jgi:hypothetical protein